MTGQQCTCGFAEVAGMDETVVDHLVEVFGPDDGRGLDGLVHLEGEADLLCLCGAGGTAERLDDHFLAVFTPADSIDRDGVKHGKVP